LYEPQEAIEAVEAILTGNNMARAIVNICAWIDLHLKI
jgi:hypothetical protein